MSEAKARRLLSGGRCHVPDVNEVVVDGDTGRWTVRYTSGQWTCTCPGFEYRDTCSHIEAVLHLTSPPPATWTAA